ncbi:MAG: hypothetical protein HY391_01190 [Deltaproteobacteria bacterium]|nr:hypothetical protein [Deltaproteobacteria bacterium]
MSWDIAFGFINLFSLIAILYIALKKRAVVFLSHRSEQIGRDIVEAEQKQETAESELNKYRKHLTEFASEKGFLLETSEREGKRYQETILQLAEEEIKRLFAGAERTLSAEKQRVLEQLYINTVNRLIDSTKDRLRKKLKEEEHQQLVFSSVKNLESFAHELFHRA